MCKIPGRPRPGAIEGLGPGYCGEVRTAIVHREGPGHCAEVRTARGGKRTHIIFVLYFPTNYL